MILVTKHIRDVAHTAPDALTAELGLELVEKMIECLINGKPDSAAEIAQTVVKVPFVADAVIAMAIGALSQLELSLRDGQSTVDELKQTDPEAMQHVREAVARSMGIPVDRVRTSGE